MLPRSGGTYHMGEKLWVPQDCVFVHRTHFIMLTEYVRHASPKSRGNSRVKHVDIC